MESRARPNTRRHSAARPKKVAANAKMQAYRERMRAAGMRQVQIWVPDATSAAFRREVRRQSLLVSRAKGERGALRAVEALVDLDGWE
jgi:hypothetical protein